MRNEWDIQLVFEEDGTRTSCEARLIGSGAPGFAGHGQSACSPADRPAARIGEELAASRALSALSRKLLAQASGDIEDETRRPAHLLR